MAKASPCRGDKIMQKIAIITYLIVMVVRGVNVLHKYYALGDRGQKMIGRFLGVSIAFAIHVGILYLARLWTPLGL